MRSLVIPLATSKVPFFTRCLSNNAIRNLCRQDWLKSHEDGTEDQFKAYWLSLPEEEIKVRVLSLSSLFSHRFNFLSAMEGDGCCAGTLYIYFTCRNLQYRPMPPTTRGRLATKERRTTVRIRIMFQHSKSTDVFHTA